MEADSSRIDDVLLAMSKIVVSFGAIEMLSWFVAVLYVFFQFGSIMLALFLGKSHGILISVSSFLIVFSISSIILGRVAYRQMVYTFEDQERAKRNKK